MVREYTSRAGEPKCCYAARPKLRATRILIWWGDVVQLREKVLENILNTWSRKYLVTAEDTEIILPNCMIIEP